jgi:hypothetical protein
VIKSLLDHEYRVRGSLRSLDRYVLARLCESMIRFGIGDEL